MVAPVDQGAPACAHVVAPTYSFLVAMLVMLDAVDLQLPIVRVVSPDLPGVLSLLGPPIRMATAFDTPGSTKRQVWDISWQLLANARLNYSSITQFGGEKGY